MTPDLPFEYHPKAILEAHSAFHWYRERSEQAADLFWSELVRARKKAAELPDLWTPYYHGTRCFRFRKYPYGLVYMRRPEKLFGIAVCHFSRRPGYWRERL